MKDPEYERYLNFLVSHWEKCTFYEGSCYELPPYLGQSAALP